MQGISPAFYTAEFSYFEYNGNVYTQRCGTVLAMSIKKQQHCGRGERVNDSKVVKKYCKCHKFHYSRRMESSPDVLFSTRRFYFYFPSVENSGRHFLDHHGNFFVILQEHL